MPQKRFDDILHRRLGTIIALALIVVGVVVYTKTRSLEPKPIANGYSIDTLEMTPEQLSESADEPVAGTFSTSNLDDPHNDPRWHAFRRLWVKEHPNCQWHGCKLGGSGMNVHHVWPESWVAKAGRPDLGYTRVDGQEFLTLCRPHHELAHNIGHGGSWKIFNPDAVHDAEVGKWNSRGKSLWFKSDAEAVTYIKDQIKASKVSKTTQSP